MDLLGLGEIWVNSEIWLSDGLGFVFKVIEYIMLIEVSKYLCSSD